MEVREGAVEIRVPDGDDVFYNPVQELNRDVTVAVLRAFAGRGDTIADVDRDTDGNADTGTDANATTDANPDEPTSYLDAMAASGIRGTRAAAEGFDATLCDVSEEAVALCRENLARNDLDGEVVRRKANPLMHERWFDVVDLDPYGTPIPFADAAFNSARDLLCVTATDTAPLCGAHFESGVRTYSAVPRNTEFHAEMGVRVLLSALVRTAARYDVAARPLLTHATNHYVRTYLELDRGATVANECIENLGRVEWCPTCLWRDHAFGLVADGHRSSNGHQPADGQGSVLPRGECPHCGATTETAGPLWLARTHVPGFVAAVRERVTDDMGTADRARKLLDRLEGELDTPTHYDQHRLYRTWSEPAVAMDAFLDALRAAGHEASRTHYGGTTFKTTADVGEIRAAVEAADP